MLVIILDRKEKSFKIKNKLLLLLHILELDIFLSGLYWVWSSLKIPLTSKTILYG